MQRDEADAICDGVVRLLREIQRRQLYQVRPVGRDAYHDATMRAIYGDDR